MNGENFGADGDWAPPSEAEQKVLSARRERNDKVSKLMGQYLLRGYKMLATTCPVCQAIEMEDRSGNLYCVGCSEVDNVDASKDDPAVNPNARVDNNSSSNNNASVSVSIARAQPLVDASVISRLRSGGATNVIRPVTAAVAPSPPGLDEELAAALDAVTGKLSAARRRLAANSDAEISTNKALVAMIRECADCIVSLKKASSLS